MGRAALLQPPRPSVAAAVLVRLATAALLVCGRAAAQPQQPQPQPPSVSFFPELRLGGVAQLTPPTSPPGAVVLGLDVLLKSVVNFGDDAMFAGLAAKAAAGECLSVVAIGGSATAGSCDHSHAPAAPSRGTAYAAVLPGLLAAAFPCPGGGHTALNLGVGGVGADYWLDRVSECLHLESAECAALAGADLVVVDTAINGLHGAPGSAIDNAHLADAYLAKVHELLLLSLHALSPSAAILYLGISTHIFVRSGGGGIGSTDVSNDALRAMAAGDRAALLAADGTSCTVLDAVAGDLVATARHRVPHVSLRHALEPCASPARTDWWVTAFLCDGRAHPTALGHQAVAQLVVQFVALRLLGGRVNPWSAVSAGGFVAAALQPPAASAARWAPGAPAFATAAEVAMYLRSSPLRVRTTSPSFARGGLGYASHGFALAEDVPGKHGLIAVAVGARAVFTLPASLVRTHARVGVLHLWRLGSYEHAGRYEVRVTAVGSAPDGGGSAAGGACRPAANATLLATRVVDCLWERRESTSVFDEISFGSLAGQAPVPCLEVAVEVVAATPPRAENKVKLLSLSIF